MIYLDHAATTPVPKAVADAMYEVLTGQFGNPSSQYPMGQEAKQLVLRHGKRQLGYPGRRLAGQAQRQAYHYHRRGTQRRFGILQMAGKAGLGSDVSAAGQGR